MHNRWVEQVYLKGYFGPLVLAKQKRSVVRGNVFFNSPRALIMVNDGAMGGDVIERNLLFNANRETADTGAICEPPCALMISCSLQKTPFFSACPRWSGPVCQIPTTGSSLSSWTTMARRPSCRSNESSGAT